MYLYVWAGPDPGQTNAPDRVVTLNFNASSPNYGKVVADTLVPGAGGSDNEPHHCGLSADGKVLACGGILASLHNHNWLFFFSLKDPAHPVFMKSEKTPLAAFPDAFLPQSDDGFLVTEMGSLDGGSPGRIARLNAAGKVVGMYPANPPDGFNPHGIVARPDLNLMVTCDFVEPASTLVSVPGQPLFRSSVRVWNYRKLTITKTIALPAGAASMDCQLLPNSRDGEGYVGGSGNGQLYLFNSRTGTYRDVFDFDTIAPGALTQIMSVSSDGTRLYVPYSSPTNEASGVAMFDVTNPSHPRLLADLKLPTGAGPHMAMLANNDTQLVVTDYFLNEGDAGKVHLDGDHFVRVLDIEGDHLALDPRFQLDFNTIIPGVKLRPHGFEARGMSM
jgi:selenium-binding protein 1